MRGFWFIESECMINRVWSWNYSYIDCSKQASIRLKDFYDNSSRFQNMSLSVIYISASISEWEKFEKQRTLLFWFEEYFILLIYDIPSWRLSAFTISEPVFPLLLKIIYKSEFRFFLSVNFGIKDFNF